MRESIIYIIITIVAVALVIVGMRAIGTGELWNVIIGGILVLMGVGLGVILYGDRLQA